MSSLSPRQMFLLDMACQPLREAFKSFGPYLVGTATDGKKQYGDVDVRCILKDKKFDKFEAAIGTDALALLGLAVGQYIASVTDLPIDFQFQRQTEANHYHDGPRHALGIRRLSAFTGDAPRLPVPSTQEDPK